MIRYGLILIALGLWFGWQSTPAIAAGKLKVLIVDGQNNHLWQQTTPVMKAILANSGRFDVAVATSPPKGNDMSSFAPDFKVHDVVLLNYNGAMWPKPTQEAFVEYVKNGGGVVVVHAADNSFGKWPEYNEIIGLGGWGGRNEKSGPYIRWRDGKFVRDDSKGRGGSHGSKHEFVVETRAADHPIMKGLPTRWLHARDELYSQLRGPAKNLTVLATAYADPKQRGTGEHEPILMTITYGKGRCFHTVLGHDGNTMKGVGFQETLLRGTEWAATGKVTFPPVSQEQMPEDKVVLRDPKEIKPAE